jgi:PEGA domain
MPPKWWDPMISRVIAVVACGFTLAACSSWMPSMQSMSFLKPSPTTEALRVESEPPGAEAKTSQGPSCRTPCELVVQTGTEFSVTLALSGYQPQTVSVRSEAPPPVLRDGGESAPTPRLAPNPIYVELQPVPVAPPAKKPVVKKKKPVAAAARPAAPPPTTTASVPSAAPPPMPAPASEPAASATNYPWPSR